MLLLSLIFFKKLVGELGGYNYKNVLKWTRYLSSGGGKALPQYDFCFVPIHTDGCHWTLASISFRDKQILYYDSLLGSPKDCLSLLMQYVQDEYNDKLGMDITKETWTLTVADPATFPKQSNGFDCGMFVLKIAEYLGDGLPLVFSQKNMPYFRERMLINILNKSIS